MVIVKSWRTEWGEGVVGGEIPDLEGGGGGHARPYQDNYNTPSCSMLGGGSNPLPPSYFADSKLNPNHFPGFRRITNMKSTQ
jgi:hypothetical protein